MKRIRKKSKIAVISPSSGLVELFENIYDCGISNLKRLFDFDLVELKSTRMNNEDLYLNPEVRAKDINDAFADDSIDGIICVIGGYDAIRILEFLDVNIIKNNPKMIMGFSDATTFLTYIASLGVPTFYGPSILAGFAQIHNFKEYEELYQKFLLSDWDKFTYKTSNEFTQGYEDWFDKEKSGQILKLNKSINSFDSINKKDFSGELWGGCIEVLEFMKGTEFWPNIEYFNNKILMFETSEEKPSPSNVSYMIRNYASQGILNRVSGVIFARCKDYSEDEYNELKELIKKIIDIELKIDLPVIFNLEFGHTDPKWILPLGVNVEVDVMNEELTILTNPFM